ncbi:hypothetical protein XENOCAPTIV_002326, partial [Xenoophorus captivus]
EGKLQEAIESLLSLEKQTRTEQNGDVKEAAAILQELQVETYGSMEKKEKVEFILEQMRLCIAVKDYIRTQIISKKINTKFFQEEGTEDEYTCRRCGHMRFSSTFPRDLLKLFTTMELMRWASLVEDYGKELREGSPDSPATDVFSYSEDGEKRWKDLKNRVVEHESEEFLSSLVVNKTIYAKVDRLAGIINFQRPKDPNDLLNDWSQKLNSLMSLVNKTTHLIAKEEMIHNLQ